MSHLAWALENWPIRNRESENRPKINATIKKAVKLISDELQTFGFASTSQSVNER